MRKFRVGDTVEVLNRVDGHHFKIGEIVKIETDCDQESMKCKGKNSSYWLSFENIKLVEVKDKEKKVNKFKVGDVVEIIGNCNDHCFKVGEKVKLYELWDNEDVGNGVAFLAQRINGKFSKRNVVRTKDLKMDESSTKIFTITVSDSSTTLTSDDKTVSVNRYYTDKHNERVAVNEVVKKYYDELDEIDRVSKLPKVGDKVKVINNGRTHSAYYKWLIKNNVNLKSAIKWKIGLSPENGGEYVIKEIHKHEYSDADLALIEDAKNAYIINIQGLEVIK